MIIHKCDRCGKEIGEVKIVVFMAHTNPMRQLNDKRYELCDECVAIITGVLEGHT